MKLRAVETTDAEAMAEIYAPIVRETAISFEWEAPTPDDFRARIARTTPRYPWLVALDDAGAVAGYAYASSHRDSPSYQWSVNTSVFVRADRRSAGVGKALYAELFERLAAMGYFRAFAGIALPNAASVALHESVGFRPLGIYEKVGFKFGAWRDVGWWQRDVQTGHPPGAPAHRSDGR